MCRELKGWWVTEWKSCEKDGWGLASSCMSNILLGLYCCT